MLRDIDMEMEDVSEWWNKVSENNLKVGKVVKTVARYNKIKKHGCSMKTYRRKAM